MHQHHTNTRSRRGQRRAVTVIETLGSLAMLSVTLLAISQMVVAVYHQDRLREDRRLASRTLENQLERVLAGPWDQITNGAEVPLPAPVAERLVEAEGELRVAEEHAPLSQKRVTLTLRWRPSPGAAPTSLSLTTQIHQAPEDRS